ncbi:sterol desaturase family protein [Aurantiacibacter gangjinensis]|uniref:Uncharacterized protein n=1 Tax=Aurantiacibacter gangjinensis TaxID=502682 RepID=A0A0G9MPK3_9SPHN|nr:sterol desaturase family protein [Aurantiacibacter gangjinensis]APE28432.1 hypothetical protein BMF35_a1603 [Aurantiacibacter gangjinensis]KLE32647.1 hypothetical protein AAW01_00890 [Aurantiacibacter gangjinensis]
MENFLAAFAKLLSDTWPYALTFAVLALVTKRGAILAAIRRAGPEFRTNLLLMIFNVVLVLPFFLPSNAALREWIGGFRLVEPTLWEPLPQVITLLAAILVIDFGAYWRHRFEHSRPMWRFHATHHADTALHWLTVARKHPIARLLSLYADLLFAYILGFPVWAIIGAGLLRSWWGHFIHADVPWTLGLFGNVLISPAAHRLHHIRDEALMGYNYGNTFTLWDRLFGTYKDPAPYVDCETGIAEGTRGFFGELARPFEKRYHWGRKVDEVPAAESGEART